MALTESDFVKFFNKALDEESVQNKLSNAMRRDLEEITERIDILEVLNEEKTEQIQGMSEQFDQLEQHNRRTHIIITGLKKDPSPDSVVKKLNTLLRTNITKETIKYVQNLPDQKTTNHHRVKVVFYTEAPKDEIFKVKKNLKGKDIWISEDLTPGKSKLAYTARQAIKSKHATQTWTASGNIFIKKTDNANPMLVKNERELRKYLDMEPILTNTLQQRLE